MHPLVSIQRRMALSAQEDIEAAWSTECNAEGLVLCEEWEPLTHKTSHYSAFFLTAPESPTSGDLLTGAAVTHGCFIAFQSSVRLADGEVSRLVKPEMIHLWIKMCASLPTQHIWIPLHFKERRGCHS